VVPELLSGPKPDTARPDAPMQLPRPAGTAEPVRNVTVDLTTSKPPVSSAQAAPAPPAAPTASVTSAPASPGTPASGPEGPATTAAQAALAASTAPMPAQAPVVESAASPPKSAGAFAVQLGSFANRGNADNLVHQLKAQGYPVYLSNEGAGKAARYRVRVGPLSDRDAAERSIAKLKASGHAATLVAPR
jgi:DedD protein